jgi:hypothetical protein
MRFNRVDVLTELGFFFKKKLNDNFLAPAGQQWHKLQVFLNGRRPLLQQLPTIVNGFCNC